MNSGPLTKVKYGTVIPTYHGLGNMDFREMEPYKSLLKMFSFEGDGGGFSCAAAKASGSKNLGEFKKLEERPGEVFVDEEIKS
ncbi:MAG: hypothetical protein LBI81_03630 [Puniceicoccales bacterium]|jgi:hypothetical protein|nr:hypothetical protein [Puniceicoccales bacterium]